MSSGLRSVQMTRKIRRIKMGVALPIIRTKSYIEQPWNILMQSWERKKR